jgi:hypothetical protein
VGGFAVPCLSFCMRGFIAFVVEMDGQSLGDQQFGRRDQMHVRLLLLRSTAAIPPSASILERLG